MHESFLHFLWQWRRFDARDLRSTEGQPLRIERQGIKNTHAGPDFFNAQVWIDNTRWAGNVELHVRSSEWHAHGHSDDPAYDNVVLHVVLDEDRPVVRQNGERIPCLELKGRIPEHLTLIWQQLEHERQQIPCADFFLKAPHIIRFNWLDRLLIERLEQKTLVIAQILERHQRHWEAAFYELLARNFGLKVNAEPFETLARQLPLNIVARHKNNLMQVEALVFGQAGLLEGEWADEYPKNLAREYRHLRRKFNLTPMEAAQWKFLRLRPANFPTVRLAQFAALLHRSVNLFSKTIEMNNLRDLEHLFDVEISDYWLTHFRFEKASAKRPKRLGRDFLHLLFINTIVPFLFYYGKENARDDLQKRALEWLEHLPPETNAILDDWANLGQTARNAYQSQALIHLKTHYCDHRRCLECAIGNSILK